MTSDEGRTDENCNTVDFFIFLNIKESGLDRRLPEDYKELINDMGGQLHDAISDPEAASMFDSLPEQLLERAKQLQA